MKVLFVGGTGVISSEISLLAVKRGIDLYLLNRGNNPELLPKGAKSIIADIRDTESAKKVVSGMYFDVVADFISFDVSQLKNTLEIFRGKCGQFIFISTSGVYIKMRKYSEYASVTKENAVRITEDFPLESLEWDYSRNKIGCEMYLKVENLLYGTQYTIVRPGVTYDNTRIPFALIGRPNYCLVNRILSGKPIVMHDDGEGFLNITHSSDFSKAFLGLLGSKQALGEAYNIVSDDVYTWNEILHIAEEIIGVKARVINIPSVDIVREMPNTKYGDTFGVLLCNKATKVIFSGEKIKKLVPDFVCTKPFYEGLSEAIAFMKNNPKYNIIDKEWDSQMDMLVERFNKQ